MVRRPLLPRALLAATALTFVPDADAIAQAFGLRGTLDSVGGFPTSPSPSQIVTPRDQVSAPPPIDSSRSDAERLVPPVLPSEDRPDEGGPNYGKPRKLGPKLYKPDPKGSPPLSPLVPYRGAPGYKRVLNPVAPPATVFDPVLPGPTIAVLPSPLRRRRPIDEIEPFAPVGVRVGQLLVRPYVEASTGYETNPNQVAVGVKPSLALQTFGGFDLTSDLSSGSVTGSLRGGYVTYPSNPDANRPNVASVIGGRYDLTRLDTIDTELRFALSTQTPGSRLLAVPNSVFIVDRPLIISEGATLGYTHQFGRLALGLKGTVDRSQFGDARQSDGSTFRFSQDNYNDYGVVARAAYELTPGLIPFTEIGADSRARDNPIDRFGYARDSIGGFARAGATVDLFGNLAGSASAGYLERAYSDPRLTRLRGPTIDGSLIYAVTPLTKLTANASTTASETILPGAAGAISRSFSLELGHIFFRRFAVSGLVVYQPNDYQGGASVREEYLTYTLKGAYSVTREVQLTASASRLSLASSFQGFRDNVFLLGVRLQR